MAELFSKEDDEESQEELQVMQDEQEDEDGPHHTLKLAPPTIWIKSEIFCLAFSDDGR